MKINRAMRVDRLIEAARFANLSFALDDGRLIAISYAWHIAEIVGCDPSALTRMRSGESSNFKDPNKDSNVEGKTKQQIFNEILGCDESWFTCSDGDFNKRFKKLELERKKRRPPSMERGEIRSLLDTTRPWESLAVNLWGARRNFFTCLETAAGSKYTELQWQKAQTQTRVARPDIPLGQHPQPFDKRLLHPDVWRSTFGRTALKLSITLPRLGQERRVTLLARPPGGRVVNHLPWNAETRYTKEGEKLPPIDNVVPPNGKLVISPIDPSPSYGSFVELFIFVHRPLPVSDKKVPAPWLLRQYPEPNELDEFAKWIDKEHDHFMAVVPIYQSWD